MRVIDPREWGDLPEEIRIFWRESYNTKMERLNAKLKGR
jgi:hypothetical protein